jgi:hypothetical protein
MRLVVRVWGWVVVVRIWFEKVRRLLRDESAVFRWSEFGGGFMVVWYDALDFRFGLISTFRLI